MFLQVTNIDNIGYHINNEHIIRICEYPPSRMLIQLTGDYELIISGEEFVNNVYPKLYGGANE